MLKCNILIFIIKVIPLIFQETFDNLATVDETMVYYFEPKHKSLNRMVASENEKRRSIAERLRAVKKVLYVISIDNKVHIM